MFISKKYRSKHFEKKQIPVEFAVLHYTAQSLEESLKIFTSGQKALSCHFLIDREGGVYELLECGEAFCYKAFHAGKSLFVDSKGKKWENFNDFSLGIELVNWNGNIFDFTESQYQSLFKLLSHLKNIYPALQNPERIVGHEHIAGFRGKKDPGHFFNWSRLFESVYPESQEPQRSSVLTKKQCQFLAVLKASKKWNDSKARRISLIMEKSFLPFWLQKILFHWILF